LGVKLGGKTTDITDCVGASSAAKDGGEADEDGSLACGIRQDGGECDVFGALKNSKLAKGTTATSVDDTLGNALVVESVDSLAAKGVLQQGRSGLVFADHLQPVIGCALLNAIVCRETIIL